MADFITEMVRCPISATSVRWHTDARSSLELV